MEVLLLKDVRRLGKAGEVKKVADGYARNYLLLRGLATIATDAALKGVAEQAAVVERKVEHQEQQAQAQAASLQDVHLVFKAKVGESGRLYGSITSGDIAERLSALIGEVDKRKVMLGEPIKELGKTKVDVKLHTNVTITVTVIVQAEE